MACDLCAGVDPITKKYVQSEMRGHLHSCFSNKLLKPFPSSVCNVEKRTLGKVTFEVYCICRMPEGGKWMVNVMYEGCVPVPCEVRNDECNKVPWLCPRCKKGIYMYTFTYGKFGGELNLAVWRFAPTTAKLHVYICMTILYRTATFESTNIFACTDSGQSAKSNSQQIFWLYGI